MCSKANCRNETGEAKNPLITTLIKKTDIIQDQVSAKKEVFCLIHKYKPQKIKPTW